MAALRRDDKDIGYIYLVLDVFLIKKRWFNRASSGTPPREVLELNLVTLKGGRFEDYIQGIYDEDEARQELLGNQRVCKRSHDDPEPSENARSSRCRVGAGVPAGGRGCGRRGDGHALCCSMLTRGARWGEVLSA
ncbi:hypothetical protein GCM10017786_01210 [Amycolatopsis deserti]|uniref:Uncharacterized protein n=1 Tax=Amycolatopsis deserti TaxID=185696 RepID=A0ABQ3IF04_9PSEU|nr:hypothetical protein GCM10017786_01210 [Amycolatopsis deserti]